MTAARVPGAVVAAGGAGVGVPGEERRGQPPRRVRVQIRTPSPASGGRATAAVASGVGPASTGVIVTPGI
jgi:hypothetical protein